LIDFCLFLWSATQALFTAVGALASMFQKLGPASAGEHRLAATTHSFAAFGAQTAETQAHGSNLLGLATIRVDRLEIRADDVPMVESLKSLKLKDG
jgi:hypothetical protein